MLENFAGMFTWGVFMWMAIAVALTVGTIWLVQWLRRSGKRTTWYDWLIAVIGLMLFIFTVQNFYGCFMETEPQAAWMFALVTGLPSLVLLAIPALQVWRRNRAA